MNYMYIYHVYGFSDIDPGCYKLTKMTTTEPAAITTLTTVEDTQMNRYTIYFVKMHFLHFLYLKRSRVFSK